MRHKLFIERVAEKVGELLLHGLIYGLVFGMVGFPFWALLYLDPAGTLLGLKYALYAGLALYVIKLTTQ